MDKEERKEFRVGFGARLSALRDRWGISDNELARRVKVAGNTARRWLDGEIAPRLDEAVSLSRYFEVSIPHLMGEEPVAQQELPDEEQRLLRIYRKLAGRGQLDLEAAIDALYIRAGQGSDGDDRRPVIAKPIRPGGPGRPAGKSKGDRKS